MSLAAVIVASVLCGPPALEVEPLAHYEVSHALSSAELTRRVAPGAPVSGLFSVRMAVATTLSPSPERNCQNLAVRVSLRDPVLYVAKEVPAGTCAWDHVMRHETQHAGIYRRALASLPARIQARLTPAVWQGPSTQAAQAVAQLVLNELEAVEAQHAALDSPDEYARSATACGGAFLRLVRG